MKQKSLLIRMVVLVVAMMCAIGANAVEAYACYTSSNKTLTFYYDNLRSSRTGTTYDMNTGDYGLPGWFNDGINHQVTKVVFDPSFAGALPTSTRAWFNGMNIQTIDGANYLNTSKVTNMGYMFASSTITSVDVSTWNTSNVTNMNLMFGACRNLTSIDLSNFVIGNDTNTDDMFSNCDELKDVILGNGIARLGETAFNRCYVLANIICLATTPPAVQNNTFEDSNYSRATLHVPAGSKPAYQTAPYWQNFTNIHELVPEAYANYTPENNTLTFYYDTQRYFRTGTIYDMNTGYEVPGWFNDGINHQVTNVVFDPSFADARPTSTRAWFNSMNIQTIDGANYLNTSEVTNMGYMFAGSSITSVDVSTWNTSNVTDMNLMFGTCRNLTSIDLSNFVIGSGTNTENMLSNCDDLQDVILGSGITRLGENVFHNSYRLASVTCMSTTPPTLSNNTFDDTHYSRATLHVPGGSKPTYQAVAYWKNFTNIVEFSSGDIFEVDGIYYKGDGYGAVMVTNDGTSSYGCYSGTVVIPEVVYNANDGWWYTVDGIDERAFYRCPYLKHLTLPNSIGIIHNEAFVDAFWDASNSTITCMALMPPLISPSAPDAYNAPEMTLYVPYNTRSAYQAINAWNQFGNIVELNYSFEKNGLYYKITGDGKVSVTYKDGNYNTYSGPIVIPRTVTYGGVTYTVTAIDNLAFFNCPNLTDVVIPETVTIIGNRTFKGCTSLTSITIPNSVTSMGVNAFENCTSLTDVVIGSGMTSIATMTFHGCEELERGTITCLATIPPTISQQNAFDDGHYDYATLYVPKSAYADYQQAQYWSNFYDMRELWSLDDALNVDGGTIHFVSTTTYPWKVITDGGGTLHYAESGNTGIANTTSTLTATVTVPNGGGTLSFVFQAWGEGTSPVYDKCEFAIDGTAQFSYGARQNDWEAYSVELEPGTHTLTWSYTKDGSVNPTGDYFAINDVRLDTTVMRGDVDGSGNVSIDDVTALIDILLTGATAPAAADCDLSGGVSIDDVTTLIDYLLTGNWPS